LRCAGPSSKARSAAEALAGRAGSPPSAPSAALGSNGCGDSSPPTQETMPRAERLRAALTGAAETLSARHGALEAGAGGRPDGGRGAHRASCAHAPRARRSCKRLCAARARGVTAAEGRGSARPRPRRRGAAGAGWAGRGGSGSRRTPSGDGAASDGEGGRRRRKSHQAQQSAAPPSSARRRSRRCGARVERLTRRREQLGPVNPLAQEEYAEAIAHVEEMETRRGDLETALRELRGVIRDTDRQIQEAFEADLPSGRSQLRGARGRRLPRRVGAPAARQRRAASSWRARRPVAGQPGSRGPSGRDASGTRPRRVRTPTAQRRPTRPRRPPSGRRSSRSSASRTHRRSGSSASRSRSRRRASR